MSRTTPPKSDEYFTFYDTYVRLVPPGDILETLETQHRRTQELLAGVGEERSLHRYGPGKWSLREVVGHLVDTERIFSFRGLCFARGDGGPFPGMNQDPYVENAGFDRRPLADLAEEWRLLRAANLRLFASWDDEVLDRRGIASGHEVSVRALLHIIAGHELHHRRILEERYL